MSSGSRVYIRRPEPGDAEPYAAAVRRSVEHISEWNPVDPDDFPRVLAAQRRTDHVAYLIVNREDSGLVGIVNVNNIVRGRFRSAVLGYNAYLPYAGTGRMGEGLRLVVSACFAPEPEGVGLHRLEINVQPGNARSIGLAQRLGFRDEGFSPRFLFLDEGWRDHRRFAITAEEWEPAASSG
jgi:ribosomal-protein-alanine N-acetyltransferase